MRYRLVFLTGVGVGFVLGARAGRERYEQIRKITRQAWDSPAVQQAAGALQAQASGLAKTTKDKVAGSVPGMAGAARSKAERALSRMPGGRGRAGSARAESDGLGAYASPLRGPSRHRPDTDPHQD